MSEIVGLWNRNFQEQYRITENMLLQKVFNDKDYYRDGSFLLMDEQYKAVGFIITKVNACGLPGYDGCAWVSSMVIDREHRGNGLGKELYGRAEEKLKEKGIEKIILGGEANCFFSGIPQPEDESVEFFRKRGFVINNDEHYDLIADVSKIDFDIFSSSVNSDDTYMTREMTAGDTVRLEQFFNKSFPGRWKYEIMGYVESGAELRNVLILWCREEAVGFCKIFACSGKSDYDALYGPLWGSLGPIGINEASRGRGIGKRILLDSLKFLKRRGAHNVIIDWTVLKDFYGQFGFEPWRIYRGAYKLL